MLIFGVVTRNALSCWCVLLACRLMLSFGDTISITEYVASNDRMMVKNGLDVTRHVFCLSGGTFSAFSRSNWGQTRKKLRIVDFPTGNSTLHFSNTSCNRCPLLPCVELVKITACAEEFGVAALCVSLKNRGPKRAEEIARMSVA